MSRDIRHIESDLEQARESYEEAKRLTQEAKRMIFSLSYERLRALEEMRATK